VGDLHVTEALGLAFGDQFAGIPEYIMAFAKARGTAVHAACHYDDEGDLDGGSLDEEVRPYLLAWRRFKAESGAEVVGAEISVASKRHRFVGTLDRVLIVNGNLCVADLKATASISPLVALQTAGYQIAWEEERRGKIGVRCCVQIRGDATYRVEWYREKTDKAVFLAAVTVAQWKRKWRV